MKCNKNQCKNVLKLMALFEVLLCLLTASAVGVAAQEPPVNPDSPQTEYVSVYVDEVPYKGRAVLYQDTTYVDLYTFAPALYDVSLQWDSAAGATLLGTDILIRAVPGENYIIANERVLWCPAGVMGDRNALYVPLRVAAKAFGAEVHWNAEEFAAYVTAGTAPLQHGSEFYDEAELYWMSRIIYAEAGAEPFLGQLAVGNVVLNRTRSEIFPDTIYGVIFDRKYGVQFTPTENGRIYCVPSEKSILAAKACLEGYTVSEEILYFIYEDLATNFWVPNNCTYVMGIGCHDFYS